MAPPVTSRFKAGGVLGARDPDNDVGKPGAIAAFIAVCFVAKLLYIGEVWVNCENFVVLICRPVYRYTDYPWSLSFQSDP